jgi:hypothetical protein
MAFYEWSFLGFHHELLTPDGAALRPALVSPVRFRAQRLLVSFLMGICQLFQIPCLRCFGENIERQNRVAATFR